MGKRRGQALVELAASLMVILIAISFMVDLFDQVEKNMLVQAATREGARWGSRQSRSSPNEALAAASWRACVFLEQAKMLPSGSCPSSPTTPTLSGTDYKIVAGFIYDGSATRSPLSSNSLPYGEPQPQLERVPIWVAIEMKRRRLIGAIPEMQEYWIVHQTTLMMDQ